MTRVLVAAVGNVLRRDDGFGPAVAERLGPMPDGVRVIETGIGGIALLQELMDGWDAVLLIDAVDQGEQPGTVFVMEPEVSGPAHVPDVHLANPARVLATARGLGVLPRRVLMVGCQPADTEALDDGLTPAVQRAVPVAVRRVTEAVAELLAADEQAARLDRLGAV